MQKSVKTTKNLKKVKFFVDIGYFVWYITCEQKKKGARMIFEN